MSEMRRTVHWTIERTAPKDASDRRNGTLNIVMYTRYLELVVGRFV